MYRGHVLKLGARWRDAAYGVGMPRVRATRAYLHAAVLARAAENAVGGQLPFAQTGANVRPNRVDHVNRAGRLPRGRCDHLILSGTVCAWSAP